MLLTGFEPFTGDETNPSKDAVIGVARTWDGPARLEVDILPLRHIVTALRIAVDTTVSTEDDIHAAGGALH